MRVDIGFALAVIGWIIAGASEWKARKIILKQGRDLPQVLPPRCHPRRNEAWSSKPIPKKSNSDKWDALVRYDNEIAAAAEKLRSYGQTWIGKFGREYSALKEDRRYLPNMISAKFLT